MLYIQHARNIFPVAQDDPKFYVDSQSIMYSIDLSYRPYVRYWTCIAQCSLEAKPTIFLWNAPEIYAVIQSLMIFLFIYLGMNFAVLCVFVRAPPHSYWVAFIFFAYYYQCALLKSDFIVPQRISFRVKIHNWAGC